MEFEIEVQLLGVRRQVIERNTFVSVFVGDDATPEEIANGCSGIRIKKIPAEESIISQLPQGYKPMQRVRFKAVLKDAAGGKSQPHIIGVVPASK